MFCGDLFWISLFNLGGSRHGRQFDGSEPVIWLTWDFLLKCTYIVLSNFFIHFFFDNFLYEAVHIVFYFAADFCYLPLSAFWLMA